LGKNISGLFGIKGFSGLMPEIFKKKSVPFEKVRFGDFMELLNLSRRKKSSHESERESQAAAYL
jgi:hypothetical protein